MDPVVTGRSLIVYRQGQAAWTTARPGWNPQPCAARNWTDERGRIVQLAHLPQLRDAALQCTADLLEETGWSWGGHRPRLCILQAVAAVTGHDEERDSGRDTVPELVSNAVFAVLSRYVGGEGFMAWESEPGRTQDEVVAALRSAAGNDGIGDAAAAGRGDSEA